MVDSFSWNDATDMLSLCSDGNLVTYLYPNVVYVDRTLLRCDRGVSRLSLPQPPPPSQHIHMRWESTAGRVPTRSGLPVFTRCAKRTRRPWHGAGVMCFPRIARIVVARGRGTCACVCGPAGPSPAGSVSRIALCCRACGCASHTVMTSKVPSFGKTPTITAFSGSRVSIRRIDGTALTSTYVWQLTPPPPPFLPATPSYVCGLFVTCLVSLFAVLCYAALCCALLCVVRCAVPCCALQCVFSTCFAVLGCVMLS
jgi:hypothetical protein